MSNANPKTLIKFTVAHAPYQIGETAAFPPLTADRYVNARIATLVGPMKTKKETKAKEKKEERKRPKITKQMVAAARSSGDKSYVTKDGE